MNISYPLFRSWKKLCLLLVLFIQLPMPINVSAQTQNIPEIESPVALLFNTASGQVLFEQDSDVTMDVGSISKLLTLYILRQSIEAGDLNWDTSVAISDYAYEVSQDYDVANVPLRQDKLYHVEELYEAVVINLAHGAAIALAEEIAGSEADFVKLMEAQLEAWELEDFNLINATGLTSEYDPAVIGSEDEGHTNQLTAEAVGVISYYLLKDYPDILEVSSIPQQVFQKGTTDEFLMTNYNKMLPDGSFAYPDIDGLSTGSSFGGGYNVAVTAEREDFRLMAIVLGAKTDDDRFNSASQLLEYGFGYFRSDHLIQADQAATHISEIPIVGANESSVALVYEETLDLTVPIGQNNVSLAYNFVPIESYFDDQGRLVSPVEARTQVGAVEVTLRDAALQYLPNVRGNQAQVYVAETIEEAPWYTNSWNNISNGLYDTMESIRVFFTDLFN